MKYKFLILLIFTLFFTACKNQISFSGSSGKSKNIFSGIVKPFLGLITENDNWLLSSATAVGCSGVPKASLYKIENDGSINESNPLSTQVLNTDARYSFDLNSLGFTNQKSEVEFLVVASGCTNEILKRPVTDFDSKQDITPATTVLANLVNTDNLSSIKLNQVTRKDIQSIINELPAASTSSALNELQTNTTVSNQFQTIFNSNPTVIKSAKPDVEFVSPGTVLNELSNNLFRVNAYHVDPNYSFAYSWKLDGVVKSTAASYNYIPSSNASGLHQIDVYVGKDNGSGSIDLNFPYYSKSFSFSVNNNILPTAPNIAINTSTPSPRSVNNIQLDISTGSSFANCASFSHLAISETNTPPGIMQFNIDCNMAGTQTESVTFSNTDGAKTIYLWAIDNEGNISPSKTVNLVLDSNPPSASVAISDSVIKGGISESVSYSASDLGVGLSNVKLYLTTNGSSYNLISTLANNGTTTIFTSPLVDTTSARLKIVATDFTGLVTTSYSNIFTIDSTNPTAPSFNLFSANPTSSTIVQTTMSSCPTDSAFVLLTESNITPTGIESGWASCSTGNGAFSISLSGDGTHHLYVWAKDLAGNISLASTTKDIVLDTTPPQIISGPTIATNLNKGGSLKTISWSVTDTTTTTINLLYSTDNGSTFNSIASGLANTGSYNWTLPSVDSSTVKLKLIATDAVSLSSNNISSAFTIDSAAPSISLSTPIGPLKGGSTITLNYSVTDTNGVASMNLAYASDGVNFGATTALTVGSTSTSWNVNSDNTSSAKLKITATDNVGNSTSYTTSAFIIDSTPPAVPSLALASNNFTNNSTAYLTVGSCTDTAFILINEANTAPSAGDSNWVACTTVAGGITHTLSGEGLHTMYAWAKDQAGNISSSANNVSATYDISAPVIAVTTPSLMQGNVSTGIVSWTLTETNVAAGTNFLVEVYNGTTWVNVGSKAAIAGINTNQSYTLSNFTVPNVDTLNAKVRVTLADAANNSTTSETGTFMIDSTPAVISSLSLNSGATTTLNNSIAVSLSASSSSGPAKITHFCLKYNNSTTPTNSDSCWVSLSRADVNVNPATSISISNFYFSIGFSPIQYTVYAWVKDEVGQISNSNSSSITLMPSTPPVINNIVVANYDTPTLPLALTDTTFPLNSDVYIFWNITDANGLNPNSVKLEYTTDEITWTTIASGLSETNQTNCTLISGRNGCYRWTGGAPTDNGVGTPGNAADDKTFKIRITATNISNLTTFGTSNNVNSGKLSLIAGNTNPGLNGAATSAIFPVSTAVAQVTTETFVMTSKGELFYIDYTRGLLYVSPNDGIQTLLIPTNNTFGTENGSITNTKLKLPYKIAVDYQDNLYIYDYDRIRKINTNVTPMTITTIIGGGASNDMTTKAGTSLLITSASFLNAQQGYDFHVLGNGDIWFTAESYNGTQASFRRRFRFYNHNDGNVYSYNVSGTGNILNGSIDLTASTTLVTRLALAYNTNTFALTKLIATSGTTLGSCASTCGISNLDLTTMTSQAPHPTGTLTIYGFFDSNYTGLDGNIYFLDDYMNAIRKYNIATNSFSMIYGSGTYGYCPAGTLATSCNSAIGGIFVNKQGKLFVVDNGIIRTIDDNGKVQDVFGQSLSHGENTLATNARFKDVSSLGIWYDSSVSKTKVIVNDRYGFKIKEFPIGGNINTIAGTGLSGANPTKNVDALTTSLNTDGVNGTQNNINMLIDSTNGYIYKGVASTGNYVLQRGATNKWQDLITAGAGPFTNMDSDSLIGNPIAAGNVTFGNYSTTHFMGMTSNYILMLDHDYDSGLAVHRGGAILLYDRINNTIEKIAGKFGTPATFSFCADGTLPTSCVGYYSLQAVGTGYTQAFYDATLDAWIMAVAGTNKVRVLKKGTNMSTLATLTTNLRSMTYLRVGGATPTKHKIWYCTTGGVLREYDLLNSTDTALPWLISNMSCYSNYLMYSPERNSLIFPVLQNNLAGVAEYLLN